MVYHRIEFVLGYIYTQEDLVGEGILEPVYDGEKIFAYEPESSYKDIVHEWHHESPLHEKMYVLGKVIHSEPRKSGYHCGECKLSWTAYKKDETVGTECKPCAKCKLTWKNHKGGEKPEWCERCFAHIYKTYKRDGKDLRRMEALFVCSTCLGTCVHGVFDVKKMNKEVVTFDGFPPYSSKNKWGIDKTEKRNCVCFACHIPAVQVSYDDACKHCGYEQAFRDDHPRSYDNSFVGREEWRVPKEIRKDYGKDREMHVVALVDDCFCCS